MASNKDLEISSMSYTSKDFASIYPDMLDLAKKITNRWDPSQSNESDPGVVLLKEAAFVADHNNYNIDKNILENFLPSATQDKSVRNICEMNGYTPRYYVAGTGEIVMYYKFESSDGSEVVKQSFNVPKFTYVISNEDETISYTQLTDLQIIADENSTESLKATCKFIEGTLQTLLVNDSSTITMENLDENNRVYLPETMVAQNGVFVKNINKEDYNDYWERDNYLLTQPIGSRKFKLDYDSDMMLPYIEFPSDISNLIGDGLIVQYISTSGEAGNVSAGTLTKIISPTDLTINDESTNKSIHVFSSNFEINNLSSISNGKNPETIDEMYQSFRKTVGTFETLISCLDYSNYIYNMEDGAGNPMVSNVYVTDRRTDYNNACNVVTFDNDGVYFKNISLKPSRLNFAGIVDEIPDSSNVGDLYAMNTIDGDILYVITNNGPVQANTINLNDFSLLSEAMTPYDLVVYALKTFAMSDYIRSQPSYAYNESFKPIKTSTDTAIKTGVDDVKCISHTFKSVSQDDVYCFKNYEPLKIVITPYNVIETKTEGDDIINNVNIAISKNFNPRHLNFGEDINLADVKKVIIDCDDRIKDVDITKLYETDIQNFTRAMDINGDNKSIVGSGSTSLLVDLVAKNVLAGRLCLFDFNNSFNIAYGHSSGHIEHNVNRIVTELPISVTESSNNSSQTQYSNIQRYVHTADPEDTTGEKLIWYIFNAPLFKDDVSGELRNLDNLSNSYTLQISSEGKVCDTLSLYVKKNDNEYEEVVYTPKDDIEISVKVNFNDGSAYLLNKKRKLPKDPSSDPDFLVPAGSITVDVKTIIASTESGATNVDYTLKENESVQIIYPNYYSDKSYGMYVNYRFIGSNTIRANTEHTLKSNEKLIFSYTTDGVEKTDVYDIGTIVKSSFDLQVTDTITSSGVKKEWVDNNGFLHTNDKFRTLASNQSISTRKPMTTTLSSSARCYWITSSNSIVFDSDNEKILGDNEYFIYTNNSLSEMMILGAGTLLKKHQNDRNSWEINSSLNTTIESITENGLSANIPWQTMNFSTAPFEIIEMNVITLGNGDSITITSWDDVEKDSDGKPLPIDNDWRFCNANITYAVGGSDKTILPKADNFYRIRSRLNLMIGPGTSQQLLTDPGNKSIQRIIVNTNTITAPYKLQCNYSINNIGGELDVNEDAEVSIYSYRDDEEEVSNTSLLLSTDESGTYPFYFDKSIGTYIIPIYIDGDNEGIEDAKIEASIVNSDGNEISFSDFNDLDNEVTKLNLKGNSLYLLSPSNNTSAGELYLKLGGWVVGSSQLREEISILVSNFKIVKNDSNNKAAINELISNNLVLLDDVLTRIKTLIENSDHPSLKPYLIYEPDNAVKINLEKYCNKVTTSNGIIYKNKAFDNQEVMWDVNNIANQMTIPQIDLDASSIEINSILRGY